MYSVEGVTPLRVTLEIVDEFFPVDNAHSAIDEAHAYWGVCAWWSRDGRVAQSCVAHCSAAHARQSRP
jgi:hypothetical protein